MSQPGTMASPLLSAFGARGFAISARSPGTETKVEYPPYGVVPFGPGLSRVCCLSFDVFHTLLVNNINNTIHTFSDHRDPRSTMSAVTISTTTAQSVVHDDIELVQTRPLSPGQESAASKLDSRFPDPEPDVRETSGVDRATLVKFISAGFSFFVAGVNDGSLGALIPYVIDDYGITTAIVSTV